MQDQTQPNAWIPPTDQSQSNVWIPPEQNQTQPTQDQAQNQLQQNQSIIEGNASDEFEYVEEEVFNPEPKIRVSIPRDLPFECKPGMKSVISVRMN